MAYIACTLYSFFLIYFCSVKKNKSYNSFHSKAFCFAIIFPALYWLLLLGMQYYVGTDYPTYYKLFETNQTKLYQNNFEYGFVIICNLIHKFNLSAQSGFFVISFIDVLFFCLFMMKFKFTRPEIFLIVYFCCATAFVNQQNALRQYAAMNIFLFAFYYLYKKSFLRYLLLVLLAGAFHRSAILLVVVYPLRILFTYYSKKNLYLELLCGIIFCFIGLDSLITWFVQFTPYASYLGSACFLNGNRKELINILTKVIYIPFFVKAIHCSENYSKKEKFLLGNGVFFYSVKLVSMSSFFLSRFSMYFDVLAYSPLYLYFVFLVEKYQKKKYAKIFELFIFLCVVVAPYLLKTIVAPSGEYLYQSILFR